MGALEAATKPIGPADRVMTCGSGARLADIRRPDLDLVIWQRVAPDRLTAWLDSLDASQLPHLRVLVQPSDLPRALEPLLDDCGMPAGGMRDMLLSDIHDLVSIFACITQNDLVDVRLERVSDDACWKFHRDCVEARLLTTYRGPATEWVHPRFADRALREQTEYSGPLERLRVHDVAMFKGSCAQGADSGIVHRSPPIAGTGQTRLLLCLNERSSVSPEPWDAD